MTSDDHRENPVSHPPGAPPPKPPPAAGGQAVAQHAWRLSGRIVAGIGQLLLWVINGLGRLLRPAAMRVRNKLSGPSAARDGGTRLEPSATAPLPRWVNTWREISAKWYFAPLTGLLLTIAALAELAPHDESPVSVAGGFALAATLPLVWRREILRPAGAMVLGSYAASLLSGQTLLVTTALAALYTLYTLAQHLPRQSAGVMAISGLMTVGVVYLATDTLDGVPWPAALVAVLAAIGLGDARRVAETAERTHAEAQELTSETLTRLTAVQREQAVMRERARIARELHDVVAHSVSMIAVQAETAPYTMDGLSREAERGYSEIARTAREALVEMRRLLSVLRADAAPESGAAPSAPQPRLDGLPDLVEQHRHAGGRVGLAVNGARRSLSATVELSAYRIVQEALTNARRHAPGADVQVELSYLPDRLAVRVVDNGGEAPTMVLNRRGGIGPGGGEAGQNTSSGGPSPYGVSPGGESSPGTGHGLVGMRERATMLGGRFAAGRAAQGGFVVEAELPFARPEAAPGPPGPPGPSGPPGPPGGPASGTRVDRR